MGLIRGALHIATYGAVSAKSKKQRTAAMQLAAAQGASQAAIKAAGGRNFDFANQYNYEKQRQRDQAARQRSAAPRPQGPSGIESSAEPARPRWPDSPWDRKPQGTLADQLERIAALHASGALNDAEFAAAKALLFESHGNPES
jgi:hypothetical protein